MDIIHIYKTISTKLRLANRKDVLSQLENIISTAGSGDEALSASAIFLAEMESSEPALYLGLTDDITNYIRYCDQQQISTRQG